MKRKKAPTRGVMYYNLGTSCIIRILVSLHSLRKHYAGPAVVCVDGQDAVEAFKKIDLTQLNAEVRDVTKALSFVKPGSSHAYLKTTCAVHMTPYDTTIWLDADTLVRGSIDELFDLAEKHEICVPNFAGWKTTGKTISKRIKSWKPYYPEHIEKALAFGPATNCGVLAFTKESKWMKEWYDKTLPGRDIYICNETVQNTLIHLYPHIIIDQKFNCSCRYSNPKDPDTRVIHYHGRKHCRVGLPHAGDLWFAEYQELVAKNTANINDVGPLGDRQLRKFLSSSEDREHKNIALATPDSPKDEHRMLVNPNTIWAEMIAKGSKEFTNVTAVTPNYLDKLKLTAPTWKKKPQFANNPLIVFAHGFDDPEDSLGFLYELFDDLEIVDWDMKKYDSVRELMLSAFVLGAPRYVETPYYVKIDCDTFFLDVQDVFLPHHFDYDLTAHKWRYSKPGAWIVELDAWAERNKIPGNSYLKPEQIDEAKKAKRFGHKRIASWLCLHKTDFAIEIATLAGARLPVASHDTYSWYCCERLPHRKWAQHNLKKMGAGTSTQIEVIRERIKNGT